MLLSTPQYDDSITASKFSLVDVISGSVISLGNVDTSKGFVVAFICNHCPYVKEIINDVVIAAQSLQAAGIEVFTIMSNNYYEFVHLDSPEHMKIFAQQHNFTFPYLVDEDQIVAKAYGAVCTPDFFGFNAEGVMKYRGRMGELKEAMLEISRNGSTGISQSPSRGCSIKWK